MDPYSVTGWVQWKLVLATEGIVALVSLVKSADCRWAAN